ncbi:prepilin-type N-terminal cleavage/methylation domain-containing protein [Oceanobacillus piezotolerans]|uniref:ComG operon protein 3 n=1 Tax=Oceanobacillus piezotolerans TaxID=2448030 RepID=A0A498DFW7_9BACI|nr:competence type IV pilus major pilin ComGC [Oceanobacillus piezotolerans]RLL48088.1 prepilin-type N-terminal cleavage/methylation domain-containing protein [Oceanobacillus piezotolerans]
MYSNNKGFTLIEMLIVLMIITVLIILIVPNLSGRTADVNEKGCDALVSLVQAQVETFYIENDDYPSSLDELVNNSYIKEEQTTCPNGEDLEMDSNHQIINPYDSTST